MLLCVYGTTKIETHTEDVASMRFLNASDATTRFGIGHAAAPSS